LTLHPHQSPPFPYTTLFRSDMKGGLLAGFLALEALRAAGVEVAATYVCNPDEEIGSVFSKAIIEEAARGSDVCFVLECARANGRSEEHTSELQSRFDLVCRP